MAATSKETLLRTMDAIVTELEQEGLIDDYFRLAYQFKGLNGPYFFANLVLTFISETQKALIELTILLDEVSVNYEDVDQVAIKLKGSASCFGAIGISRACANLRCGVEVKSHIGCIQAKSEIQLEFRKIRARLDAITQLEQQINSK